MPENEKQIHIKPTSQSFPKSMFFNHFHIDSGDGVRLFYFGFLDRSEIVRDAFACAIDESTIERQKDDLLNFMAKTPVPTDQEPAVDWMPKISSVSSIQFANFIRGARVGNLAEVRLFSYSIGEAI